MKHIIILLFLTSALFAQGTIDKKFIIGTLLDQYITYEKMCYSDSTIEIFTGWMEEPYVYFKIQKEADNFVKEYPYIVNIKWIHKAATFKGFMKFLSEYLELEKVTNMPTFQYEPTLSTDSIKTQRYIYETDRGDVEIYKETR